MTRKLGYKAPVSFSEEEVPDEDERAIMQDGLNAMTRGTIEMVEFVIAQRQKQFLLVMRDAMKDKKK